MSLAKQKFADAETFRAGTHMVARYYTSLGGCRQRRASGLVSTVAVDQLIALRTLRSTFQRSVIYGQGTLLSKVVSGVIK